MRLIFDITSLSKWHCPPVGIIRVEFELLKYIHTHPQLFPCIFVKFSSDKNSLELVSEHELMAILTQAGMKVKEKQAWYHCIDYKKIAKKIYNTLGRTKPYVKKIIQYLVPARYHSGLKKIWISYRTLPFKSFLRNILLGIDASNSSIISRFLDQSQYKIAIPLMPGDIFLSVGLTWDDFGYKLAYYLKKQYNIKFVGISYDVIPLSHPQYASASNSLFFYHFYYLNYLFDKLACISNFSKNEFLRLAEKEELPKTVELKTIYIGDDIVENQDSSSSRYQAKKPYVLYVSTIEVRKNHIVLLKAWKEAYKNNIDMPNLICVGKIGWGITETLTLYKKSPELKKKISFLTHVDDMALDNLYKNALFTVFPSHVEGWGLGAAESLAYGKVCIISRALALDEATRGLMPKVDAEDVEGWMNSISQLSLDIELREKLEKKIKTEFSLRRWKTFAEEFFEFITESAIV